MSKEKLDIINKILEACYQSKPDKLFVMSLMHQYEERGSLSKKQLEGLFGIASGIKDMPVSWLATLEATILKMPTREKAAAKINTPLFTKNEYAGKLIDAILAKYPQHKRVLFFKNKYEYNDVFSPSEITELEKFHKLLIK
jgi:hypothetical protein